MRSATSQHQKQNGSNSQKIRPNCIFPNHRKVRWVIFSLAKAKRMFIYSIIETPHRWDERNKEMKLLKGYMFWYLVRPRVHHHNFTVRKTPKEVIRRSLENNIIRLPRSPMLIHMRSYFFLPQCQRLAQNNAPQKDPLKRKSFWPIV